MRCFRLRPTPSASTDILEEPPLLRRRTRSEDSQEDIIGAELVGGEGPEGHRARRLRLAASAAAFLVAFAAVVLVMLPNVWALLAGAVVGGAAGAGTYGALVGRAESLQRRRQSLSAEQGTLREKLGQIDSTVRTRSAQLPPSSQGQLRMMVVGLDEIVERWDSLRRSPEHQEAVRRTITHHLPRTLELFLALPDDAKPRHAAEFKEQVGLMAEAVAKTRDTVVAENLQALRTNRWLLEESLTDPDEKLFREHGL